MAKNGYVMVCVDGHKIISHIVTHSKQDDLQDTAANFSRTIAAEYSISTCNSTRDTFYPYEFFLP
jgi:hypothetical protein